ncbi:hypothetical protein [Mycoplasma leonicaptivi]|uniref:hypothetical protein n=1 Tax=Mycoplasma leonicaptivi TaxID=36742 RepID=UPI000489B904|nr:hypothetical protein [Mycoplasma leonicaptivi]
MDNSEWKNIFKKIKNYETSVINLDDLYLKKQTKNITSTFILTKKKSFYDEITKEIKDNNNDDNVQVYVEINNLLHDHKNIDIKKQLINIGNSNRNSYKVYSTLSFEVDNTKTERLKISDSKSSEHERTYFGEYEKMKNGYLKTTLYLKELDLYRSLLRKELNRKLSEKYNTNFNYKQRQNDPLNKIYEEKINWLNKKYFDYIFENWDFSSYIDVEYKND